MYDEGTHVLVHYLALCVVSPDLFPDWNIRPFRQPINTMYTFKFYNQFKMQSGNLNLNFLITGEHLMNATTVLAIENLNISIKHILY